MNKSKTKSLTIKNLKKENGEYETNQKQICNILNKTFIENGPNLAKIIPLSNTNVKRHLGASVLNSFVIHPTDENEIQKIIDNLKIGKASGPDGINTSLFKKGKNVISKILTALINESLITGIFPDCLEKAIVALIHKKDSN